MVTLRSLSDGVQLVAESRPIGAEGHLRKIIQMIEDQRSCLDLAQQLHAVEKAICEAKKTLIHDHIDHCLEHSVRNLSDNAQVTVEEFKQITKYL